MSVQAVLAELERLHRDVDERCARLAARHAGRLHCAKGCCSCCVDGLTVFEIEAQRIRRSRPGLLRDGRPHPRGACAFLDSEGACRVYEDRPYVCRTQGLPLRWREWGADGTGVELRDVCPLNDDGSAPVETLTERECWEIGPVERRLARLQDALGAGSPTRVALRDLFERDEAG